MTAIKVALLTGSDSDLPAISAAVKTLRAFDVAHEIHILSAHRTPDAAVAFVRDAEKRGAQVFICSAGMAAHLAGVVAAHTCRPVIGVPMPGGILDGLDALLSTVQMPPGIPVLTTAVGKAGATNAALGAIQILALSDAALADRLTQYKQDMAAQVLARDGRLQELGVDKYQ